MKTFTLFTVALLMPIFLFAQKGPTSANNEQNSTETDRVEYLKNLPLKSFFGFNFSNSVPQNQFMDDLKKSGPGFGLVGGYKFEPIPIAVGGRIDFHFFGNETRYIPNTYNGWEFWEDTLETSNSSIPIDFFVRLEPNLFNTVFPYVEGGVGFTVMSATASYTSHYLGDAEDKDEFSAYINYYVGVGTNIKLVDFVQMPNSNTRMLLDVNFRYLSGDKTQYYTVKPDPNNESSVIFDKYESIPDQILFNLGLTFQF
jgi:hypothetical protein